MSLSLPLLLYSKSGDEDSVQCYGDEADEEEDEAGDGEEEDVSTDHTLGAGVIDCISVDDGDDIYSDDDGDDDEDDLYGDDDDGDVDDEDDGDDDGVNKNESGVKREMQAL